MRYADLARRDHDAEVSGPSLRRDTGSLWRSPSPGKKQSSCASRASSAMDRERQRGSSLRRRERGTVRHGSVLQVSLASAAGGGMGKREAERG